MMHNTIFATRYLVSVLSPINHLSGLIQLLPMPIVFVVCLQGHC